MKIEIHKYDPKWKNDFLKEKNVIADSLDFLKPDIEHIGSTSIQGLGAKPIIDIMVGCEKYQDLDLLATSMISLGFTYYRIYDEIMPERRLFTKMYHPDNIEVPKYFDNGEINPRDRGFIVKVNCHCVVKNDQFWQRHIFFRDTLRNNNDLRNQYYKLKKQLSEKDWLSINDYTDAKNDFIKSVEAKM